jgi:RecA/RadA recombinase
VPSFFFYLVVLFSMTDDNIFDAVEVDNPTKPAKASVPLAGPKRVKKAVKPGRTAVKRTTQAVTKQDKLWEPEKRAEVANGLRQGLLKAAQEKFGVSRVFGDVNEIKKLIVGIPIPSLAFEWLIDSDVLPLRSMIMWTGTWSTYKSVSLYELMRWFIELNGLAAMVETENKFDIRLASSVVRHHGADEDLPFMYSRAYSMQEAQAMLTSTAKNMVKLLVGTKENPGPGLRVPCLLGLDSLAAATAQENIDSVQDAGHSSRQHPINALLNKYFTQAIRPELSKYPFLLVFINHRKAKNDDNGNSVEYTLGGSDQNFMEAIELRNVVWRSKIESANFSGAGVRISTTKNSFGQPGRSIKTRFLWWEELDEATGKVQRRHMWDWNWAIVSLLAEADGSRRAALKRNDLLVDVKSADAAVGCMARMSALGMGKDEYISWQELGQQLHDNLEIRDRIRNALGIQRGVVLDKPLNMIEDLHIGKKKKKF